MVRTNSKQYLCGGRVWQQWDCVVKSSKIIYKFSEMVRAHVIIQQTVSITSFYKILCVC